MSIRRVALLSARRRFEVEFLVASAVGVLAASGIYLILRARTFSVVLGLTMLSYAVNVFLFSVGRLAVNRPAVIAEQAVGYSDRLPRAVVLTGIVIGFGMTAVVVVMALRAYIESDTDHVDIQVVPQKKDEQ